jgi:23S rRNA-/tRNA-specific pseudouridylate synthase
MPARQVTFPAPTSGGRLDQILLGFFPDQSRSRLQQWIQNGCVSVDGKPSTRPGVRLRSESILVRSRAGTQRKPSRKRARIVFENAI